MASCRWVQLISGWLFARWMASETDVDQLGCVVCAFHCRHVFERIPESEITVELGRFREHRREEIIRLVLRPVGQLKRRFW